MVRREVGDDDSQIVNLGESNAFFAVECRIASPNFCVGVAWARRPSKPRDDTLSSLHVIPLHFLISIFGLVSTRTSLLALGT